MSEQKVDETKKKTTEQVIEESAKAVIEGITKPVQFTPEQFKEFMNAQQKQIEALAKAQNESFVKFTEALKPKTEGTPSSPAAGGAGGARDWNKVAEYFMTNGKTGEGQWSLNKEEYIEKWWNHYCNTVFRNSNNKEAITTTNVPGITFDREVLLVPGGQSVINIRPFVNFKLVPDDSDTFHWHKIGKVTFGAITAGTPIAEANLTASRIAGTVAERGGLEKVSFLQTKTLPIDLVDTLNSVFMAGAIHDEAALVLEAGATATAGDLTSSHWIDGDGDVVTSDDAGSNPLKFAGINEALQLLETQGYRREEATAFLHPVQHAELISDMIETLKVNASNFTDGVLANGIIQRFLGCRVVVTPAVYTKDNATNDAYRAIVAVPQALGLASKGSVEIETDRDPENSQIIVTGRHYVDAAVIESTGYVRISTTKPA